jgi:hypothetical protein
MRPARELTLSDADRTTLERWPRGRSTQARLVTRARLVLAAAEGRENQDIAVELNISRGAVARWRDRFAALGVAGIKKDAPGIVRVSPNFKSFRGIVRVSPNFKSFRGWLKLP